MGLKAGDASLPFVNSDKMLAKESLMKTLPDLSGNIPENLRESLETLLTECGEEQLKLATLSIRQSVANNDLQIDGVPELIVKSSTEKLVNIDNPLESEVAENLFGVLRNLSAKPNLHKRL